MPATLWKFSAMDCLFFRDGSPMNIGESAWVDSIFPPTGQTLQGAIRAAMLDYLDADIVAFQQGRDCLPEGGSLKKEIGDACSLGRLRLTGPFPARNDELFFPAPLDLVKNQAEQFSLLLPSLEPVQCDLGAIRLPTAPGPGWKPQVGNYISATGLKKILQGNCNDLEIMPLIAAAKNHPGLVDREPKIGLARDNTQRTNIEGMLFAVAPVRPRKDVALLVQVNGVSAAHYPSGSFLQKLGGEGKLAAVTTGGGLQMPSSCINNEQPDCIRFKIVFITQALFADNGNWLPEGFEQQERDTETGTITVWHGAVNGCPLDIVSACIGKAQKTGGWNLAQWHSKPLRSFIPAGSVFFCEAAAEQKEAVLALHDSKIGMDIEYGFGHILIGKW